MLLAPLVLDHLLSDRAKGGVITPGIGREHLLQEIAAGHWPSIRAERDADAGKTVLAKFDPRLIPVEVLFGLPGTSEIVSVQSSGFQAREGAGSPRAWAVSRSVM